jgi:hypothetical protein
MTQLSPDEVRRRIGTPLTDMEARALADWYASLSAAVAGFPTPHLKEVEPPLRSVPGPRLDR